MTADVRRAKVGTEFRGKARHLTMARALALSGGPLEMPNWPEKNLHTDLAAAEETGLAAVVASGTQWVGYTVGLLVELCGEAWFEYGELEIRITRSVKVGETLQPMAILDARESVPEGLKLQLGVRCENQDGEHVLIGKASCVIPVEPDRARRST
jgi:acyl dehydratase